MSVFLANALKDAGLVQSFSGVRTVLGQGPQISDEHAALAWAYAYCYVRRVNTPGSMMLILGRDPRPTGVALCQALARGFLAGAASVGREIRLVDLGIITTPLAETAVRALEADGGVMVTASHNPLAHNGFKFLTGCGANDDPQAAPPGALLSAWAMGEVINDVAEIARSGSCDFNNQIEAISDTILLKSLAHPDNESDRIRAERAYLDVIGQDWGIAPHCLKPLTLGPALLDPNGGAACGIDARVLEHFGVRVIEVNAELGYPEHGIDTDGIDPASGRHMLLRVARAAARERAHFGVAFDYDADRGNLVLPGHDESAIISPQRVAAFNVALALARRALNGGGKKLAVVMSDATSLACERVAAAFGAEVFHVETGEINVVTRMHTLRKDGYDVPVGVEGANGGTIFETSTCRDGLQAALSAALGESHPEIAREWVRISSKLNGHAHHASGALTLKELVESVPTNPNVFLRFSAPPISHGEFKKRVEDYFAKTLWPKFKARFDNFSFHNYEGAQEVSNRTGDESGGWRLLLESPTRRAFVFLRGSRTEAGVWRMIVDADDPADFALLEQAAKEMFEAAAKE
ncbi:MAG: hypothetical protein NT018_07705 [Armatimonadetes bacterium]|nr:hypothetical protein [Armatimonadota bacterium]